ncbi:MAG: gamma carbonic anhydrase family protein [Methanosarcinales archaeon]|nr:gamma carbonic anhydrase family protein [ANME-2 cluster archaeon]MDF1532228.1 gamma carbonic anhydrase family protein [ANME-2 cluster archaeon]MDW7775182.1 gamma carbonic anhydrase family protein [Methanosarcinales archaeon]
MESRIRSFQGMFPKMDDPIYIDPLGAVIGDVELSDHVSIWSNAVVKGDPYAIHIGPWTNIQDNCTVHAGPENTVTIGGYCVVGHGAILHGCTIGNGCMIGMGSIVMNNAVLGDGCLVGAGTLITEGKTFPPGSLVMGSPGKVVRQLTTEEIAGIREAAEDYWERALGHMQNR